MAQNDVIKEIVFMADEQYEAPALVWGISLGYLLALVMAEVMTVFVSTLVGIILYLLILIALLVHSSVSTRQRTHHFLVILSIVPLMRLSVMTIPPANFEPIYWYLLVGILLAIAVFFSARLVGFGLPMIGLRISKEELPAQLLIGMTGLTIGLVEYLILRPEPLLPASSPGLLLLSGLALLVLVGFLMEVVFRGLLQAATTQILDRWGIIFVAVVFALQYLVFRSLWNLLFVFLVGLAFGVAAARTRSLLGVSISHGLANVSLFMIFPLLVAGAAAEIDPPLAVAVPATGTPTKTVQVMPSHTPEPVETQSLVLIPVTGPTATWTPTAVPLAACGSHPNWVVYVAQQGDTLESISETYGIEQGELLSANCFDENHQVAPGQGLYVPFDLIPSPTQTLPYVFSSLNTATATPTRKPVRKSTSNPTSKPVQEVTPITPLPTSTLPPPSATPQELPTLAPTQIPNPLPPPTQGN